MVWGIIIALVMVVGIYFLITSTTNKQYGIISWILTFILWTLLSFETASLIKAIAGRSQRTELISSVCGALSNYTELGSSSSVIGFQEANEIALACKVVMPLKSDYFFSSDFQGKTYSEIPAIISINIEKALRNSVWNKIGWILLTVILGIVAIALFMERKSVVSRGKHSRYERTQRNVRNNRYHSRR